MDQNLTQKVTAITPGVTFQFNGHLILLITGECGVVMAKGLWHKHLLAAWHLSQNLILFRTFDHYSYDYVSNWKDHGQLFGEMFGLLSSRRLVSAFVSALSCARKCWMAIILSWHVKFLLGQHHWAYPFEIHDFVASTCATDTCWSVFRFCSQLLMRLRVFPIASVIYVVMNTFAIWISRRIDFCDGLGLIFIAGYMSGLKKFVISGDVLG